MNTLMQITSKKILLERLETKISEFCVQENGLTMSSSFQKELKETTEQILFDHQQDGQVLSPIEGTYFFHAIFNTLLPDVYIAWCTSHKDRLQIDGGHVKKDTSFKMTQEMEYVMNTWVFELPESMLIQELKQITQKRFNSLQTKSTIELIYSGENINIQPSCSDCLSKEFLKIYMQVKQMENNYNSILRRLCPVH